MDIEIKTWLKDIEQAILEINSFVPDVKNFRAFQKDLKTKRAVERNIAIIGEAVSRILKVNPAIKISHTRKIVDTRNRIIHGYDSVSEDILPSSQSLASDSAKQAILLTPSHLLLNQLLFLIGIGEW